MPASMIPFLDFKRKYFLYRREIDQAMRRVFESGWFILGAEVANFEQEFARYLGVKYVVGVNSGTDALALALRALGVGPGDEVITQANMAAPTVAAIRVIGAVPVFVDVDEFYGLDPARLEPAITKKTKVILPVHLYGQACQMTEILKIAKHYNLKVVEDACQAHGALYKGTKVGTLGEIGCFSFYPTKNLGAFGDGGAVVTNSRALAERIKQLRNYGEKKKNLNVIEGYNARLDELQAALLRFELKKLNQWNKKRKALAQTYQKLLADMPLILPQERESSSHVWHLFVVRSKQREKLLAYLKKNDIGCQIHYPRPVYQQPAYRYFAPKKPLQNTEQFCRQVFSLPLYPELEKTELNEVCRVIKAFFHGQK